MNLSGKSLIEASFASSQEFLTDVFLHLDGPLMVHAGADQMYYRASQVANTVDEGAHSLEQLLAKLQAGRGAMAVGWEENGKLLLRGPRFAGKIEMLPIPLSESDYYVAFSRCYWDRHPTEVRALWQALAAMHCPVASQWCAQKNQRRPVTGRSGTNCLARRHPRGDTPVSCAYAD